MTGDLSMATVNLKRDEAAEQIRTRAEAGEDPMKIIDECREGMLIVGDRYNQGEFFLAELGSIRTDFQAGIRNITTLPGQIRPWKRAGHGGAGNPKG